MKSEKGSHYIRVYVTHKYRMNVEKSFFKSVTRYSLFATQQVFRSSLIKFIYILHTSINKWN